jgi:hypothetical protein
VSGGEYFEMAMCAEHCLLGHLYLEKTQSQDVWKKIMSGDRGKGKQCIILRHNKEHLRGPLEYRRRVKAWIVKDP